MEGYYSIKIDKKKRSFFVKILTKTGDNQQKSYRIGRNKPYSCHG